MRGFGRGQQEGGEGEGLDIPHDMTFVVVVVGPVRQAEHRSAEEGRGMGRCVQVVVGGVGHGLPALPGAGDGNSSFPDLLPGAAILIPQPPKAALGGHSRQTGGLTMRLVVHLAGDQPCEMVQRVRLVGPCLEAVRG